MSMYTIGFIFTLAIMTADNPNVKGFKNNVAFIVSLVIWPFTLGLLVNSVVNEMLKEEPPMDK